MLLSALLVILNDGTQIKCSFVQERVVGCDEIVNQNAACHQNHSVCENSLNFGMTVHGT